MSLTSAFAEHQLAIAVCGTLDEECFAWIQNIVVVYWAEGNILAVVGIPYHEGSLCVDVA